MPNRLTLISEVVDFLNAEFHPEYQESYDNSGFLLGDAEAPCTGVLTAVDLTADVVAEALDCHANLIVTHHPFIFSGVKRITPQDATGKLIYSLIEHHLCVYAAHTNLDNLPYGVNGILAERLGLTDCHILQPMAGAGLGNGAEVGAGMVGMLPEAVGTEDFLQQVKATLGLPLLRHSRLATTTVRRVAICGGAGNFLIGQAIASGAEVYLTGDLKYHDFQRAEGCITLADIGHFESEQYAPEIIYSTISNNFCNFACYISRNSHSFVSYM